MPEKKVKKQPADRFLKGVSGNPTGWPKGGSVNRGSKLTYSCGVKNKMSGL